VPKSEEDVQSSEGQPSDIASATLVYDLVMITGELIVAHSDNPHPTSSGNAPLFAAVKKIITETPTWTSQVSNAASPLEGSCKYPIYAPNFSFQDRLLMLGDEGLLSQFVSVINYQLQDNLTKAKAINATFTS
jgi:hypothetical protein